MTTEVLYEHLGSSHRLVSKGELALRREEDPRASREPGRAITWLQQWVSTLELSVVFTCISEACLQLGIGTLAEALVQRVHVDALVKLLSRLEVERVIAENAHLFESYALVQPPADAPMVNEEKLTQSVRSLLLNCPIDEIEAAGARLGQPNVSHRCRLAFEALKAHVARMTHPAGESLRAAGQAYAEGRLEIPEVAALWSLAIPDVVALLEEQGYRRTVEGLRLSPEARQARFAAIRLDRERRGGEPTFDQRAVDREVIASQRIEGVDARPWLRP